MIIQRRSYVFMTNEIRLFENPEFGSVRTVVIDNEP